MVSLHAAAWLVVCSVAGQTTLYDFYSDHCGPCRSMDPTVQAMTAKGYPIQRVNVERDPALAQRFGVSSIPCFVMVADGREVGRIVGATSQAQLERLCQAARPAVDPRVAAGPRAGTAPPRTLPGLPVGRADIASAAAPRSLESAGPPVDDVPSPDDALIAATVRLRIEDPRGLSCGTGTIVDARQGEALILTCGHLFRDSHGKGRIEVDLFGAAPAEHIAGTLVAYNLESDVALVSIQAPGKLPAARIAPAGHRVGQGEPVVSVGCNHGGRPTAVRSRVTAVDRYKGWPNLTIAGESIEGRSGGGLFTQDGLLVGVCNARDPKDHEALFAALGAIHAELDKAQLAFVYDERKDPPATADAPAALPKVPFAAGERLAAPVRTAESVGGTAIRPAVALSEAPSRTSAEEQAALDEIRRRVQEGAEVICVIRSRKDPTARSEVITLDKVSPEFLNQLYTTAQSPATGQLTVVQPPRELVERPVAEPMLAGKAAMPPIVPAVHSAMPNNPAPAWPMTAPGSQPR